MVTITLLATVGLLVAYDVPLAVELPALGLVAIVLRYLIGSRERTDKEARRRLTNVEKELRGVRAEAAEQRHLKHQLISEAAAMRNTLQLTKRAGRRCTCGALEPIIALLEEIP